MHCIFMLLSHDNALYLSWCYLQVGKDSQATSFDPELGERAMLLRNHCGDCGICVARWHPKTPGKNSSL